MSEKSVYKSLMILKNNMKLCCTINVTSSNGSASLHSGSASLHSGSASLHSGSEIIALNSVNKE